MAINFKYSFFFCTGLWFYFPGISQTPQPNLDSLIAVTPSMPDDTQKVKVLNNIADIYLAQKNHTSAVQYATRAFELAELLGFHSGEGKSKTIIGVTVARDGDFNEAIKYFEAALLLNTKAGDLNGIANARQNMIACYDRVRDYPRMAESCLALYEFWTTHGNNQKAATALMEAGLAYSRQNQTRIALDYWLNALAMFEALEDKKKIAGVCNNISRAYQQFGEYENALEFGERALALAEEMNLVQTIADASTNIGVAYSQRGEYQKAKPYYEKAYQASVQSGYKRGMAFAMSNIAADCANGGNTNEAIPYNLKALELFEESGDKKQVALIYSNLGGNYNTLANYDEALKYLSLSLSISDEIGDRIQSAYAYLQIGSIQREKGDYPAAVESHLLAIQIMEEHHDVQGTYKGYLRLGSDYSKMGRVKDAFICHETALRICKEAGIQPGIATALHNIGNEYYNQGNYPKALEYYLQALKIYQEIDDKSGPANIYNAIGGILSKQEKYDEALENYFHALTLFEETGEKSFSALVHYNISEIYTGQRKYEEALQSQGTALQINKLIGNKEGCGDNHTFLGKIYSTLAQHEKALNQIDTALAIYQEIGYKAGLAEAYIQNGNILNEMASHEPHEQKVLSYAKAIENLTKGEQLAAELGRLEILISANKAFADSYSGLNDYQTALEYQSRYLTLKDSLLNNETNRQLEQLRTQFEVEMAVAAEKAHQDSLLAAQKFQSEMEFAERNARHQMEIAEARAQEERAVEAARYRYLLQLTAAKTEQEKQLAEQQYQNDLQIAAENARYTIALADEKAKQQRREAEAAAQQKKETEARQKRNLFVASGAGLITLFGLFTFFYQRQRNLKEKAIERAETIHKMTELELQSLRAQLNPHFMFNSLNAIQELILLEENDKSHTYLARFAKLLRMLLENANNPLIPLSRELEFLHLYLSLEKLRIPDLEYEVHIAPGINTEQVRIPNMVLQPYIENAIWHGLSPKKGQKKLEIQVHQVHGDMVYTIEDNGIGRQKAAELKSQFRKEHKSRGMELLTKRFKLLSKEYGSAITTEITDVLSGEEVAGTRISLTIPLLHPQNLSSASLN